jgi:pimeloyl-ACP methyl ester carboxylesterase
MPVTVSVKTRAKMPEESQSEPSPVKKIRGLLPILAASVALTAQTSAVQDRQIVVAGHTAHYLEAGSGPPVVLLHGLGADARAWRSTVPALAKTAHVYALDFLGFGQSEKPQTPYRVSTLTDFVSGFIDALQIKKATVVGHSLGGWVAARLAASHPDQVDKLVLVDAAGYAEDQARLIHDFLSQLDPSTAKAAEQILNSLNSMPASDQEALRSLAMSYFARRLSRPDGFATASVVESILKGQDVLDGSLGQIKAPTLIVWGRDDQVVPLRAADAFAQDVPGARKIILDGCGHRPQLECPAAFNAELLMFLK